MLTRCYCQLHVILHCLDDDINPDLSRIDEEGLTYIKENIISILALLKHTEEAAKGLTEMLFDAQCTSTAVIMASMPKKL